jgi:hypothetical protein
VLIGGLPLLGIAPMGMVVSIFALTLVAARAGTEFRWKEVLLLALVLTLGSYVTFIVLLKLQIPVWPVFAGA